MTSPTGIQVSGVSVHESAPPGTLLALRAASDGDVNDAVTFAIPSDPSGKEQPMSRQGACHGER